MAQNATVRQEMMIYALWKHVSWLSFFCSMTLLTSIPGGQQRGGKGLQSLP